MKSDTNIVKRAVSHALSGKGSHVEAQNVFAGLDWKVAGVRPKGVPHSLFQLLNHMIYWQDWVVRWLDGENPPIPKHASGGWPGSPAPASRKEWVRAVQVFRSKLDELNRRARKADLLTKLGKHSRLGMLHAIAAHNSYHVGQAVQLREMLGAWPPPSGGITW